MTGLYVVAGAAIGAPLRYLIDLLVQSRHDSVFPWGTLAVNTTGSLLLGATAGALGSAGHPAWIFPLIGTGLCGALTTFSTFGYETVRLVQEGSLLESALNALANVTLALLACAVGWAVASAVFG